MTHLLGSEFCIESLTRDLKDVQTTVDDVTSRVGKVNFQSWKFPHQLSIDVDVSSLLQVCVYDDDNTDEDNQVAHITLYDLLIDRLLLLLQCFTVFNEKLLVIETNSRHDKDGDMGHSMSIGLTTKRCWSRISQISLLLQRLSVAFQKKQQPQTDEDEETEAIKQADNKSTKNTETNTITESPKSSRKMKLMEKASPEKYGMMTSSADVMNRSAQTLETSYEICHICTITQSSLHQVARSIVVLCKSLNLPTAMENYIGRIENQTMSIPEINRWKTLQMKDLSRIERHVRKLMNDVEPLKREVAHHQAMRDQMKKEEDKLRNQFSDQQILMEETMRRKELQLKQEVKTLQMEVEMGKKCEEKLKNLNSDLNDDVSKLKNQILQLQRNQFQLESEQESLRIKLHEEKTQHEELKGKEEELVELRGRMDQQQTQIQQLNQQVKTEKVKNAKLSTHQQSVQSKQKVLTEKLECLNDECEKLRDENSLLEDEKFQLEDDVTSLRHQLDEGQRALEEAQEEAERKKNDATKGEIARLERELSDSLERERMLAVFPDMCDRPPPVESSDDIVADMRHQVEANEIRVKLLQDENANLRKAVRKLSAGGGRQRATREEEEVFNKKPVRLYKDFDFSSQSPSVGSTALPSFRSGFDTSSPASSARHEMTSHRPPSRHRGRAPMYQSPQVVQLAPSPSDLRKSFKVGPGKRPGSTTPSVTSQDSRKPWM